MACAATWLAWVARRVDAPGGASASDRRVHALVREVQGCIDVACVQVEQVVLPHSETWFAQLARSHR